MRPSWVRWRIFALLFMSSAVGYSLRTNMSVAGEPMMRDIGLTELQLGYVLSAFAWAYALFQIPGGAWGNAIGGRRALTIAALGWGAVTLATGLVPGSTGESVWLPLGSLIALRFFMGAFQAPLFPVGAGVTARWFPPSGWGLPNGLSSTGLTLGAAAAAPLVAWLMVELGWRLSFILMAPLPLVLAAVWWWYSRDHPKQHAAVNEAEHAVIAAGRGEWTEGRMTPPVWRAVLRNRDVLLLTLSYFCLSYVFFLFFNWFFYYLVEVRGFSAHEGGRFSAAQWVLGAVGATLGGLASDRLVARYGARRGYRSIVMTGLFLTAPFLVAGSVAEDGLTAVVLLSLAFGCTQLTEAGFWAAATAVGGEYTAAATGVMNAGGSMAGGIGAILVPVLASTLGWTAAVASGAVFAVVGGLLWLGIRPDRRLRVA